MKQLQCIIGIVILTFVSCESRFPDFIKKKNDIYMKLMAYEDDGKRYQRDSYVRLDLVISYEGEIIYRRYKEEIVDPKDKDFDFLLIHMNEGDSCWFKVPLGQVKEELSANYISGSHSKHVDVTIRIHQVMNQKDHDRYALENDVEMTEQVLLKRYMKEIGLDSFQLKNGIYVKRLVEGMGEPIDVGKEISINYKGYFINRLEFDNNYRYSSFTFTYGTPDQVIEGLDIVIKGMKKGEKSKIIIPSQLAFGDKGASTQIVPSFTSVIYELEIVNVK